MLMCAHDRSGEHHELVVGIAGHNLENPHENATFASSTVPSVNGLPRSVALG
jgi:hypothetical protein